MTIAEVFVVLNFWATWCEPCRTETPMLVKMAKDYEKRGLRIVGLNLDESGSEALVKKFVAEYKVTYPVLVLPADSPLSRVENLPTTLLIDAEGRLVKKYVGAVPENVAREDIEKLTKADTP